MTVYSVKMRASRHGKHTSGAETLCTTLHQARATADAYLERAATHPHGEPDDINVHITAFADDAVHRVPTLQVQQIDCETPEQAARWMQSTLQALGVTCAEAAIDTLYRVRRMRGAALLDAATGQRLDADHHRGVRASTFGHSSEVTPHSTAASAAEASKQYHSEALTLASKVAATPHLVAELCISDDPEYTTGYLGAEGTYFRIPNIKAPGSECGGRVFILNIGDDPARLSEAITFLAETPVLVEDQHA